MIKIDQEAFLKDFELVSLLGVCPSRKVEESHLADKKMVEIKFESHLQDVNLETPT